MGFYLAGSITPIAPYYPYFLVFRFPLSLFRFFFYLCEDFI